MAHPVLAKDKGAAPWLIPDFACRFLGRDDWLGDATLPNGRGVDMRAIGDRFCKCFEDCCALKNNIGASRRRTRIRIGPAISRRDQTHFSESEIQHGACCLANRSEEHTSELKSLMR